MMDGDVFPIEDSSLEYFLSQFFVSRSKTVVQSCSYNVRLGHGV